MESSTPCSFNLSEKRKFIVYIPWLSLFSFALVLIGTITWGASTHAALERTGDMLSALKIDVRPYMSTVQSVAILSVVLCGALAAAMVLVSCGRSWTEFAVDREGKAVRGAQVWLGVSATLTALWWLVLVLLMLVIFFSAIWYGVTYASTGALRLSVKYAQRAVQRGQRIMDRTMDDLQKVNADTASRPPESSPPALYNLYNRTADGSYEVDTGGNVTVCPEACLNLASLEYIVEKRLCVCMLSSLSAALSHARAAHSSVGSLLVGSCLLWAGASFLLMTAAAEFAKAKRERALLLRAHAAALGRPSDGAPGTQKQLQEQQLQTLLLQQGAAAAAAGGGGGTVAGVQGYGEADNVPLLKEHWQRTKQPYQEALYQGQPYHDYPYQEHPYQEQPYQEQYVEMSYPRESSARMQPYQEQPATVVIAKGASDGGAANGVGVGRA